MKITIADLCILELDHSTSNLRFRKFLKSYKDHTFDLNVIKEGSATIYHLADVSTEEKFSITSQKLISASLNIEAENWFLASPGNLKDFNTFINTMSETEKFNQLVIKKRASQAEFIDAFEGLSKEKFAKLSLQASESWRGKLELREEINTEPPQKGLRKPQIGAVYSTLGHWSTTNDPATIVLPTGVGKTELMICLMLKQTIHHLLIVVPSDQLRSQISNRFTRLGLLLENELIPSDISYPIVTYFKGAFSSVEEAEFVMNASNVLVTTMTSINACPPDQITKILYLADACFIDEAHHLGAITWKNFKLKTINKPTLQFTATPFREDGRDLDAKIIYRYPLLLAQQDGYFQTIGYYPIYQENPELIDREIATKSIELLKADLSEGFDHLILARVRSKSHAQAIFDLYKQLAPQFNPVNINSDTTQQNQDSMNKIHNRESRIIVCVNMFGEGYDLPNLKICSMHDPHKSLTITLQFIGRFTRASSNLGSAKFVASAVNQYGTSILDALYSEDADWNKLIQEYSDTATGAEEDSQDFVNGFAQSGTPVPLKSITPKMSTVIYKSKEPNWDRDAIEEQLTRNQEKVVHVSIQKERKTAFAITQTTEVVDWALSKQFININWCLYLFYWSENYSYLFINSTNTDEMHKELAEKLSSTAELVYDDDLFKVYGKMSRLIVRSLGLGHTHFDKNIRHTTRFGGDIIHGLLEMEKANKIPTNIFMKGFLDGEEEGLGWSKKGRVWKQQAASTILEWTEWCETLAENLVDATITKELIMGKVQRPVNHTSKPPIIPLFIDWPDELYDRGETNIQIGNELHSSTLLQIDIMICEHSFSVEEPIRFNVISENFHAEYYLIFNLAGVSFKPTNLDLYIKIGRASYSLSDYFNRNSPFIGFTGDTILYQGAFYVLNRQELLPFDVALCINLNWSGTDITVESETWERNPKSIQYKIIEILLSANQFGDFQIVCNDDDSGEIADIIAIQELQQEIKVVLFHCKYSSGVNPGSRIGDLYEVCGQAQKSTRWKSQSLRKKMYKHIVDRSNKWQKDGKGSRFRKGDQNQLNRLLTISKKPLKFVIYIVQPGVSKQQLSETQQNLLGITQTYLKESISCDLFLICSS